MARVEATAIFHS